MGKVLYRKYRSRSFEDVIGQEHITQTLKRALAGGRVAHAYLFTGPRGVGKTSVARLLAHAVNDLPYEEDATVLDIIEIDAASNRRIDEIRDLREKVHIAPVSAKYKVYIIDEVHMLTNEAFNALLKTLEEPPAHVIFILATTEAHKVPDTIISRTQRFAFHPIDPGVMARRLQEIAGLEELPAEPAALELIAEHAAGSFRDALSLLDQLHGHSGRVDTAAVESVLGLPPLAQIEKLLAAFRSGSLSETFAALDELFGRGITSQTIARRLSKHARDRLLADPSALPELLPLIERLLDVEFAVDPRLELETALAASLPVTEKGEVRQEPAEPAGKAAAPSPEPAAKASEPKRPAAKKPAQPAAAVGKELNWIKLLESVKAGDEPLYALLRMAEPSHRPEEGILELRFRFDLHAKRLQSEEKLRVLREALGRHVEPVPEISVIHDPSAGDLASGGATVEKVADILGGEVISI
jgi:DNA polymerase-3 subunit gamma/tau